MLAQRKGKKYEMKKILFVIPHPDDVACGMGGIANLLKDHFQLHVVCATKGERGLLGHSLAETAVIRQAEQEADSALLGASLEFLGRVDRELYADQETCERVADVIRRIKPIAVFTIWPVDYHPDHSAISEIVRKAVFIVEKPIEIVYCEEGKHQTTLFAPDVYVDISAVIDEKIALIRCHVCQNKDDKLVKMFLEKSAQRGEEAGRDFAEGFRVQACNGFEGPSIFALLDPAQVIAPRGGEESDK